jgi:hypothetical protein
MNPQIKRMNKCIKLLNMAIHTPILFNETKTNIVGRLKMDAIKALMHEFRVNDFFHQLELEDFLKQLKALFGVDTYEIKRIVKKDEIKSIYISNYDDERIELPIEWFVKQCNMFKFS